MYDKEKHQIFIFEPENIWHISKNVIVCGLGNFFSVLFEYKS